MITEKELAAYLPYKLQLLETHSSKIGTLSNVYTLGKGYDTDDIKISIDYCEAEHLWMFKPILHPLSSLTKEITINGETFAPIDVIEIDEENDWFADSPWVIKLFLGQTKNLDFIPYGLVEKLLSWKFDIFNMIERGDAIVVTNEFNPYK